MGVRVDNPSTGVYIVRRGDKVTKEFVKQPTLQCEVTHPIM